MADNHGKFSLDAFEWFPPKGPKREKAKRQRCWYWAAGIAAKSIPEFKYKGYYCCLSGEDCYHRHEEPPKTIEDMNSIYCPCDDQGYPRTQVPCKDVNGQMCFAKGFAGNGLSIAERAIQHPSTSAAAAPKQRARSKAKPETVPKNPRQMSREMRQKVQTIAAPALLAMAQNKFSVCPDFLEGKCSTKGDKCQKGKHLTKDEAIAKWTKYQEQSDAIMARATTTKAQQQS